MFCSKEHNWDSTQAYERIAGAKPATQRSGFILSTSFRSLLSR